MTQSVMIRLVENNRFAKCLMILVVVVALSSKPVDGKSAGNYVYKISNGQLRLGSQVIGIGYSGKKGNCRNNPSCTSDKNKGPIPVGSYNIGKSYDSKKVGPLALPLTPSGGQNMYGRSDFLIHGDNPAQDASEGCIILARNIREQIKNSGIKKLDVVA